MAFNFRLPDTDIPPLERPEGSINAKLHELAVVREHVGDISGMLLLLPRTGIIVTPIKMTTSGWGCRIVEGNDVYPRGGYDIDVSNWELQRAPEALVLPVSVCERGVEYGVLPWATPSAEPVWYRSEAEARAAFDPDKDYLFSREAHYAAPKRVE
jgi:hypothetical protein